VVALFIGGAGAWVITRLAVRVGLLDHPKERSSHFAPKPKGGGVGILAASILVSASTSLPLFFWVPAACMAFMGLLTDIYDFSPKVRLSFQFAAGGIVAAGVLDSQVPHLNDIDIAIVAILAIIYIVGTANFYNFMDGINGIAGITGMVSFGLLAVYIDMTANYLSFKVLAISLLFACAGFLPFNIPNARVFMGDVGSILLGFLFASMVILLSKNLMDFICLTSFLFPFYADELTTMIIRITKRENLLHPHRRHFYQLLANEKGIAHWKISVCYGLIQLIIGLVVLEIRPFGLPAVIVLLLFCFAVFVSISLPIRKKTDR